MTVKQYNDWVSKLPNHDIANLNTSCQEFVFAWFHDESDIEEFIEASDITENEIKCAKSDNPTELVNLLLDNIKVYITTTRAKAATRTILDNAIAQATQQQNKLRNKDKDARWKGAGMDDFECTACWDVFSLGYDKDKHPDTCPHCGAHMK